MIPLIFPKILVSAPKTQANISLLEVYGGSNIEVLQNEEIIKARILRSGRNTFTGVAGVSTISRINIDC